MAGSARDQVGCTALIRDGAFAGESLTLHENGYWHITHPQEVLGRFPWAVINAARTKEGRVVGIYNARTGLYLDDTLHAKEARGRELGCAHCGHIHAGGAWGPHYFNATTFTDTAAGPLCPMCEATLQFRDESGYDDDDDDAAVPADVLAALPRRTSRRSSRSCSPCAICIEEPAPGTVLVSLPCGHEFCEPCISTWLARSTGCPTCRAPVVMPMVVPSAYYYY